MNYYAAYAQHLYKFMGGKLILNDGLRLQFVNLHSTIVDNSFFNLPFTEIKQIILQLPKPRPFLSSSKRYKTGFIAIIWFPLSEY
jgi:hypothetical protein